MQTRYSSALRYLAATGCALAACLSAPAVADTADSILASAKEAKRLAVCLQGFVWREANPRDLVCVPPPGRNRVAAENRAAPQTRAGSGAYGENSCKAGYVWREAYTGDVTCVSPASRDMARSENALAAQRRVRP